MTEYAAWPASAIPREVVKAEREETECLVALPHLITSLGAKRTACTTFLGGGGGGDAHVRC